MANSGLIALFLALTFLLGAFPLKDVDFYWHLRTGDLIRQTWTIPHTDIFTFTREGTTWIDLHWLFQIAISWLYERGGVVGLNLAKCAITCVAVFLLLTARRREWPVWVMVLSWLPALLVLGGRMYVRPETLTLLYIAIYMAVVTRWDRFPRLAFLLPLVQVLWVNSQGLFVLGPIILVFALLDALLRKDSIGRERKKWWRTIALASLATGAACLVNPYGISGAFYPLELASTMSNPVFSRAVAELLPVPEFIRSAGWWNLPLQLHLFTIVLGALSFLIPLSWLVATRLLPLRPAPAHGESGKRAKASAARGDLPAVVVRESGWRISLFRLLLYASFCALSMRATRNTHQFAAVVGSVTAWNFGEWAAALRGRRRFADRAPTPLRAAGPQLFAWSAVALLLLWVGTGSFYIAAGEGRTIGLGEEPLWFPHGAVKFAGQTGMPNRFLSFHNGHASLFEYYHGPARKVYTDPRLEVTGADLFERYMQLEDRLKSDKPGWAYELDELKRPVILVDHQHNWAIGAALLRSPRWRCVWFDPIAAVFVHDSFVALVRTYGVDFAARHFRPDPAAEPRGLAELKASARAMRNYVPLLSPERRDLAQPLAWLGSSDARRILREQPDSLDAWKALGQIELFRDPPSEPIPRLRAPFDPVFDLSLVRATYALRRALEFSPYDAMTLILLRMAYDARLMFEPVLPLFDRMAALYPINKSQREQQAQWRAERSAYEQKLSPAPARTWRNLSELDEIVTGQLSSGRAESAADLLERANPPERSWEVVDRIATLRLHLGEPARARLWWQEASSVPNPALRDARIAATYLVEGDFQAARRYYLEALQAHADLFEARYSLAVLEQDDGHAQAAYDHALRAIQSAPDAAARSAARSLAAGVVRFAGQARGGPAADGRGQAGPVAPPRSP